MLTNVYERGPRPAIGSRWPARSPWRAGGVAVLVLALAPGGCKVAGAQAAHSESQHQAYQHQIDRVELDLDSGDIQLSPGSAGQVVVQRDLRWDKAKPTITEKWNGATLQISNACASGEHNCATNYEIELPQDVPVVGKTKAGNITTRGMHGTQDLETDAGDVTVEETRSALTLRTNAGKVSGTGLGSTRIDAFSSAGNVSLTLTVVPDNVSAKSDAGDVDVRVPKTGSGGYSVQASTDAGTKTVSVDVNGGSPHKIVASSRSGNVTVRYAL